VHCVQEYVAAVLVRTVDPVCHSVPTLTSVTAETDLSATAVKLTPILVHLIRV